MTFYTSQPLDSLERDVPGSRISWKEGINIESTNIIWQLT